jgi:Holliday junction resolvasome RuvABC ATP-dependent DNA helicase subunit
MYPKRPLIIHYPKPIPVDVLYNYFNKCDIEDKIKNKQLQLQLQIDSEGTRQINFKSEKWITPVVTTSITKIIKLEKIKREQEIKKEEEIKNRDIKKYRFSRQDNSGWTTVQSKNKW